MKKTVISLALALFIKLVFIPIFTQTPIGPVYSMEGWLYDLNVLTIVVFAVTIPLITYKLLKKITI
jgi:hypothetical protein